MKKTYQSPEALIVKIQIHNNLLLSTSNTEVTGANGGWVKEQVVDDNSAITDKSVWDEEW